MKNPQNIYLKLLQQLLIILAVYTVFRLLFFLVNQDMYPSTGIKQLTVLMFSGLRFDISAILYSNMFYIIGQTIPFKFREKTGYQKFLKYLFITTNAIMFVFCSADLIYFRFTLRRTTLASLKQFSNDAGNFSLLFQFFIDFWWGVLIFIVSLLILILTYKKSRIKTEITKKTNYYLAGTVVFILSAGICFFGMRGNLGGLPLSLNHAPAHVAEPMEVEIVLNTPFCLIRTTNKNSINYRRYFDDATAEKIAPTVHHGNSTGFRPKNVVIFILEGFGDSYSGYMPFVDSLKRESLHFEYAFANGTRSTDALPAILASVPALMHEGYANSIYANNGLDGLAKYLSSKGYSTSFYHGAPIGSMRFMEFSRLLGIDHYYGQEDFNNDNEYDGHWGIWDEPFLQFAVEKISEKTSPALSVIFTLTSHHPFKIPNQYANIFKEGELPILKSISYTDWAVRKFFEQASQQEWFQNTLFVFSADHTNGAIEDIHKTSVGRFLIPIFFYTPDGELKSFREKQPVQQIDILPTILDYLNYDSDYFAYGKSVLKPDTNHYVINYIGGQYQVFKNQYVLHTSENGPTALYHFATDPLLKTNLINDLTPKANPMDSLYKALIQQYNNKIIENRTSIQNVF